MPVLRSRWVLDSGEIWLTCRRDIHRYDGSGWVAVGEPVELEDTSGVIYAIFEYGGRVRVAGILDTYDWNGSEWTRVEVDDERDESSTTHEEILAARGQPSVVVPRTLGCNRAFRIDDERAWCFGGAQIYVGEGDTWTPTLQAEFEVTQPAEAWGTLPPALWAGADTTRAWGSDPGNVFRIRAGEPNLEHYDGNGWCVLEDGEATDVHGAEADDVWIATGAGLVHFDGEGFVRIGSPEDAADPAVTLVHAVAPGVVLAVVDDERLYRYDGRWSLVFSATDPLPEVEGTLPWTIVSLASTSPDDVWVVRTGGIAKAPSSEVFRSSGATWSRVDAEGYMHIDGLSGWWPLGLGGSGSVFTRRDEVWLAAGGSVSRLPEQDVILERAPTGSRYWFAPDDALWVTTSIQALRYGFR